MMKYLILSAMQEEIAPTIAAYQASKIAQVNGQDLYGATIAGHDFYFLNSGIGKVNAAITTTCMILTYQPDCIFSIGTAGGLAAGLEVGDLILADKMAFHDVDVTAFQYELGQLPKEARYFELKIDTLYESLSQVIPGLKLGGILTGDQFIHEGTKRVALLNQFEGMLAAEMESTAIVMTAQHLNTPCYVLRGISDLANEASSVSFDTYLQEVSEQFKQLVTWLAHTSWRGQA
jgi:adenosylhomocysteine nucleosidase